MKFTEQGEVELEVVFEQWSSTLVMKVRDSGIGINEKQQAKLFQPFVQADSSTTRRYGGTGLGLVICSKIIKALGGEIELKSELGKGSEFRCSIPLEMVLDEEPEGEKLVEAPMEFPSGMTVLVVDDNKVNRTVLCRSLKRLGLEYQIADNGLSAVELCRMSSFDLILMDCQMPVMDGFEATQIIKQESLAACPIVAVTADAFDRDRRRCLDAGMDDFLAKPVPVDIVFRSRYIYRVDKFVIAVLFVFFVSLGSVEASDPGVERAQAVAFKGVSSIVGEFLRIGIFA